MVVNGWFNGEVVKWCFNGGRCGEVVLKWWLSGGEIVGNSGISLAMNCGYVIYGIYFLWLLMVQLWFNSKNGEWW